MPTPPGIARDVGRIRRDDVARRTIRPRARPRSTEPDEKIVRSCPHPQDDNVRWVVASVALGRAARPATIDSLHDRQERAQRSGQDRPDASRRRSLPCRCERLVPDTSRWQGKAAACTGRNAPRPTREPRACLRIGRAPRDRAPTTRQEPIRRYRQSHPTNVLMTSAPGLAGSSADPAPL